MNEIERLTKELEDLQLQNRTQEEKLSNRINEQCKEQKQSKKKEPALDRDGNTLYVGAKVTLLTRGRFRATQGTVTQIGTS